MHINTNEKLDELTIQKTLFTHELTKDSMNKASIPSNFLDFTAY